MTRLELAQVLAYIGAAIGKPPSADLAEVYMDLLGDIPIEALRLAAKKVVLEHKWATFPTVSELREAAAEVMRSDKEPTPAEAWAIAWRGIGKIDPEVDGSIERGCKDLPPLVVEAMQVMGIHALCYGKEPVAVVRAQFMKVYEQLQTRNYRERLLPNALKKEMASLPSTIRQLTSKIGEIEE